VIFEALQEIHAKGEKVEPSTVALRLEKKRALEKVGGVGYLAELAIECVTSGTAPYYAEKIKDLYARRQLDLTAKEILDPNTPFEDVLEKIKGLGEREVRVTPLHCLTIEDFHDAFDFYRGKELLGYATGFSSLDEATGGLQDFVTIAGLTGVCKTTFALNLAASLALGEVPVLYYDLENRKRDLVIRIACNCGGTTIEALRRGEGIPGGDKILRLLGYLFLEDNAASTSPESIRAGIRYVRKEKGMTPVLFIDPLHKLEPLPETQRLDKRNQVDLWLGKLEQIKNQFDTPVVVVSELVKQEEGKPLGLHCLKETGRTAYTSKLVLAIDKPQGSNDVKLWVLKNSFGASGFPIDLQFDPIHWRITEKQAHDPVSERMRRAAGG
jgi:replicative DNA helicase